MKAIVTTYLTRESVKGNKVVMNEFNVPTENVEKAVATANEYISMRGRNKNYIPAERFLITIKNRKDEVVKRYDYIPTNN